MNYKQIGLCILVGFLLGSATWIFLSPDVSDKLIEYEERLEGLNSELEDSKNKRAVIRDSLKTLKEENEEKDRTIAGILDTIDLNSSRYEEAILTISTWSDSRRDEFWRSYSPELHSPGSIND